MSYEYIVLGGFIVSTLVGFLVPFGLASLWQRTALKEMGVIFMSLALIGACAGTSGGMSRVGAAGSIIPAFLGLLGGLSIYLFGVDRSKGLIASFGASAIALSLIVSYTLGANYRNVGDDHRDIRAICAKAYTDPDLLSNAAAFEKFRERLDGFCVDAMAWNINR